jgi:hypothetical protein
MSSMPRIYVYKITADDGIAPCPQSGLLTLGVCKPAIRRTAKEGDYLIGIGSNTRYPRRLIYVAQIDEPIPGNEYYLRSGKYWPRRDCIYVVHPDGSYGWVNRGGRGVHNPSRMPSQTNRDVGRCGRCSNAIVLPSRRFVYFGRDSANYSEAIWLRYPDIIARIFLLKQSHLVKHEQRFKQRLHEFCEFVLCHTWNNAPILDAPHDKPSECTCHDNRRS